ncbi:hypothetical protein LOK49_LG11G02913 [Camellia lanceoleosa]|uniref:Uncharacterized protein n=1 Tax=Camellia lanceoleosa TaxID=1840588 RepID=A0ACC0FYN8_9ERIC|nr:hypothetical protein LOK49_LG11G02913 [Camellia lanceoleosa]
MVWNLDVTSVSINLFDGSGGFERDHGDEFSIGGNDLDYEFGGSNTISGLRETEMSQFNDKNAFKEQEAHKAIAKLFCCAALPTEKSSIMLKKFITTLIPNFVLVLMMLALLLGNLRGGESKVKQVMRNLDGQISLSVDILSAQLKDALELEPGGEFSSQDVQDNYEVPSAEEWEKVRSICELVDRHLRGNRDII